jgi:hypothetical protein
MATIREKCIDAIRTYLTGITVANGYSRDIGPKRVYGIKETPSSVIVPAIFIMQGEEQTLNDIGERYSCELEIAIGFVDNNKTNNPDKDATTFMGEIQKVLPIEFEVEHGTYPPGPTVTQRVVLKEVGNTINISAGTSGIIMGQITYILYYRRNIFTPDAF